jgi:uncharacterized protein (TIGR02118 family)
MIKVSLLYPNSESGQFNMDYYCNRHIPMLLKKLGRACRRVAVEEGLASGSQRTKPAYVAMAHLYFSSVKAFQTAFNPHEAAIMEDLPNYTNVRPMIQISAVRLQKSRKGQ